MTSPAPLDEDGNLPEARRRLGDAVAKLCDPQATMVEESLHWLDCAYVQLLEALPGGQGEGYSGVARSVPPLWITAMDLLNEIDTTVAVWCPRPNVDASVDNPPPMTVIRLQEVGDKSWRPQDVKSMDQISGIVEAWAEEIKSALAPTRNWSLPNACPACQTKVVYRRDVSGDLVRQPALQIGTAGCECQRCHHVWEPAYFTHLARVLGYELPAGVLE